MDNQLKWSIKDKVLEYFNHMTDLGEPLEKIIIKGFTSPFRDIPEVKEAVNLLIGDDYAEIINEDEIGITKNYYKYLAGKCKRKKEELCYDKFPFTAPKNIHQEEVFAGTISCQELDFSISEKLKQRFCKDMSIPISIYKEPYFESRLRLYNSQHDTINKYKSFLDLVNSFNNEQEYFEYYNKLKDKVINHLKDKEGIISFKQEDMNKYEIKNENFPKGDIYKITNSGKTFISIDMVKANFSSLRHYDKTILDNASSYEEFMGKFTKYNYFKESKYLRQVIFGNHNPKRQASYQKYLMDLLLTEILNLVQKEQVVSFSSDEIVIELNENIARDDYVKEIKAIVRDFMDKEDIALRLEAFKLSKVFSTEGYVKEFLHENNNYEFKCLDPISLPFVIRAYLGEEIEEKDRVFVHEGKLAKLIDVPEITIGK